MNALDPKQAPEAKTAEQRTDRQTRALKWIIFRFVAGLVIAVGLVVFISVREGGRAQELEKALIENCQTSPTRAAITEILEEEIKESHGPLTEKVAEALHLSPKELKQITDKNNAKKQAHIDAIEPADCEAQYK